MAELPSPLLLLADRAGGWPFAGGRAATAHPLDAEPQLRSLEEFFGVPLFERRGRRLVLTALGEETASYADDIFRLGRELVDVARGRSQERRQALRVGIVSSVPKSVAYKLLEPGLAVPGYGSVVARQDRLERLLDELSAGRLHLVLSDTTPPESASHRVYAHLLGESAVLAYATKALAKRLGRGFPGSLNGAPMLLPTAQSSLRRLLDRWFEERDLRVQVAGEFDDAGLMRVAGAHGHGVLPVRAALRAEVEDAHAMEMLGSFDGLVERYYVVSPERRVRHPAVSALVDEARVRLAVPARGAGRAKGKRS